MQLPCRVSSAYFRCWRGAVQYRAVLPQGAFDVQSIRAAQTADLRAKQTRPSGPTRMSARVNSKPSDGCSPGSMTARRFHLEEVVESFLRQPLLTGLSQSAAAQPPASPPRTWAGAGSASTSRPKPSNWSTCACGSPWMTCSTTGWLRLVPTSPGTPTPTRRCPTPEQASPVRPAGGPVQRVPQ